jgi:Domain of unknown function DUF29
MSNISYEGDLALWSRQQAALLRAGNWAELDIEHLADEIEDVGKSERREIISRMAILIAHLLKWRYQPARRSASWEATIRHQRNSVELALSESPSLKSTAMADAKWQGVIWNDAVDIAIRETGLSDFPENCPWSYDEVLDLGFWPG